MRLAGGGWRMWRIERWWCEKERREEEEEEMVLLVCRQAPDPSATS